MIMENAQTLLQCQGVSKRFDISGGFLDQLQWRDGRPRRVRTIVRAVNNVSFDVRQGETLSVVGESGCGKSSLARTILNLYPADEGEILYRGARIDHLSPRAMLPLRTKMQMVFQDPYASLNPRMTVRRILEEPVRYHNPNMAKAVMRERVAEVMRQVGMDPTWADNFPHEFSGGQRQRISIARALVVDPEFIVADEPISALDVSIQAQILNLLMDAQQARNLTYLLISHDLSVVEHISDRVAVMYLGSLCELAPVAELFDAPRHPYTQALLSAIPRLGCGPGPKERIRLSGELPSPIHLPPGCVFHTRCPYARQRCRIEIPQPLHRSPTAQVSCFGVEEGWL
jgi:peptide/nickel transport system ATP-binding protein